jgi:putative FmdB family regulatory protein
MPLYEYECDANKHRFEVIQKFSDPPVEKCPQCGSTVHKLLSSPGFRFKGSGWYITDYAKKDSAPGAPSSSDTKKDATSTPSTESKSSTASTDSKTTPASSTNKTE